MHRRSRSARTSNELVTISPTTAPNLRGGVAFKIIVQEIDCQGTPWPLFQPPDVNHYQIHKTSFVHATFGSARAPARPHAHSRPKRFCSSSGVSVLFLLFGRPPIRVLTGEPGRRLCFCSTAAMPLFTTSDSTAFNPSAVAAASAST
jgi:hypothetical protein